MAWCSLRTARQPVTGWGDTRHPYVSVYWSGTLGEHIIKKNTSGTKKEQFTVTKKSITGNYITKLTQSKQTSEAESGLAGHWIFA